MGKSDKELFSVENEIALHSELPHEHANGAEPLPESEKATQTDGMGNYYCSVEHEPWMPQSPRKFRDGYPDRSLARILLVTVACGIIGGLFAVPAMFIQGNQSFFLIVAAVVFGPFAEETLKQCGMLFQLEKLPSHVRHGWQFFLAAALGGGVFSVIENLIYKYVYLADMQPEQLAATMEYRWFACTALHICCPMISAMGLRRVWRESVKTGMPCQIDKAFPWFVLAMAVHGIYNLSMIFWERANQ